MLTAQVVASSRGETGWVGLRAGYDALDADMKEKVVSLSAYHSLRHSQKKVGFATQKGGDYNGYGLDVQDSPLRPLVKTHPERGCHASITTLGQPEMRFFGITAACFTAAAHGI